MTLQISLAWRYLRGRALRTLLTTLAVVFGVFVIFAMNVMLPTITRSMFISVQAAEAAADFTLTHAGGGSFSPDKIPELEAIDGVRAVSPTLTRSLGLPADFYDDNPQKTDMVRTISLVGVDPARIRSIRSFSLEAGRFLEPSDRASAVITQTFADYLGAKPGMRFRIPTVNGVAELAVVGIMPPQIGSGGEEVIVALAQAQDMTGEPGKVNAISVGMSDPTAKPAVRTDIEMKIREVMGDDISVNNALSGPEAYASIQLAQTVFNVFGVLALFMGGFIIFNTFRTVVAERRRDLGMLRALGAGRRTVVGIILAEGLIQGFAGSAAGMALGYAVAAGALRLISPILGKFVSLQIGAPTVPPLLILACLVLGIGTSLIAALVPALAAGAVTPMEAMRPAAVESGITGKAGIGFTAGAAALLAAVAALFSGRQALIVPAGFLFLAGLAFMAPTLSGPIAALFGRVAEAVSAKGGTRDIARGNLARHPSRAAATASSTMIGLAVIVAAGGLLSSLIMPITDMFRKSLGSDYLFLPPSIMMWNSDVGASPQFARDLRAIDGVKEVATMRYASSTAGNQAVSMIGIDPAEFPMVSGLHFMEGNESSYKEIAGGRSLIANGVFLMSTGAKVGGSVSLTTLTGPAEYRVAALATDMLNMKAAAAFISQDLLSKDFGRTEDVLIQLNLAAGADAAAAESAIKAVSAEYPQFMLIRGQAYFQSMADMMGAALAGIVLLFAFLSLPSLIATINTLSIGVLERTREIGMIRAVGGSARQIRRMVLSEALLLAGIGTTLGILGGLCLSRSMVTALKDMFPLGYTFPWVGILAAALFGLGFGALASLIPARQAVKLQIVQALRYE
jgi:putative ABC transport system permease protein